MIYTLATVYYCLEPVRGYHLLVSFFLFFFPLPPSRRHRLRLRPCVLSLLLTFSVRDLVRATSRISVGTMWSPVFSDGRKIVLACGFFV